MLYGNYCYIFIENFPKKFSPCGINHLTSIDFVLSRISMSYVICYYLLIVINEQNKMFTNKKQDDG